jgi:hypothetical protein
VYFGPDIRRRIRLVAATVNWPGFRRPLVRAAGVPSVELAGGAVRRPGKTGRRLADLEPIWQYMAPGGPREIYDAYQILRYFRPSGR